MTDLNDIYQSAGDYLKAADLANAELQATITGFEVKKLKEDENPKIILKFANTDKMLVLNKTNAHAIGQQYGQQVEAWAGKPIIMYPTMTDFGGTPTPCIRVRVPLKTAQIAPVGANAAEQMQGVDPNDDIPF